MADLLLLLETSGERCSVAVACLDGKTQKVLAKAEHSEPMKHTAMLLPLIKEAFAKTDFKLQDTNAVVVSTGPGSYTALRAGYSSAKGLCLALEIPMITICTLKALASVALTNYKGWKGDSVAVLPARRKDVYFARFDHELNTVIKPVCVEANDDWWLKHFKKDKTLLSGPTVNQLTKDRVHSIENVAVELCAENLLTLGATKFRLGEFANTASVEPNYVKPPFITKAKPKLGI